MIPALRWTCDFCPASFLQEGPRAGAMPAIPPVGWLLVGVSWFVPAHSTQTASGEKVKVGDARETARRMVCPACRDAVLGPLRL